MFSSKIEDKGSLHFPEFTGLRIMMMPLRLEDEATIPEFMAQWRPAVRELIGISTVKHGTAYLTVDEAVVRAGETHRRPGMHVDGVGAWGGGGGGWARNGMLVASSRLGCRGWHQDFSGAPGDNGDCSHLADQCAAETLFQPGRVYWCSPLAVHESLPQQENGPRTLVRLSMPNDCPWFDGYTQNPTGILPTGPVLPARTEFMGYRS
jgi:hypothetical protein